MRPCLLYCLALTWASPAIGCETDTDAVPLPGESEEQFQLRDSQIRSDHFVIFRHDREESVFRQASVAYFAIVTSSLRASETHAGVDQAIVQPKKALKGILPTGQRKLVNTNTGGLCYDAGDGGGGSATTGEIVLVVEGLPIKDDRPNGIDSFSASAIRSPRLLEELASFVGEIDKRP